MTRSCSCSRLFYRELLGCVFLDRQEEVERRSLTIRFHKHPPLYTYTLCAHCTNNPYRAFQARPAGRKPFYFNFFSRDSRAALSWVELVVDMICWWSELTCSFPSLKSPCTRASVRCPLVQHASDRGHSSELQLYISTFTFLYCPLWR